MIEKKAQLAQTLAWKKNKLASQLRLNQAGEECSLEKICSQFRGSKLVSFESEWFKLIDVMNKSIEDDLNKQEIKRLTNGETESLILNGNAFIHGAKGEETDCNETNEDFNKRILQYLFENIDQNAALRNVSF